ncbi:MAG: rhodanese-like domain-containing protein [Acidobacteria bacterium]|nr:rhodanese-like domain-containing protein [Acidobacteriota bacterium]
MAVVLLLFFVVKRDSKLSPDRVRQYLKDGALVIDVRTPSEFSSGHIAKAINLPLDDIETSLPRRIQDTNRVLLLHCQSGMRSSVASKKLKNLGYVNAFNLGSYTRAAHLLNDK